MGPAKILVVDDEPMVRRLVLTTLESCGYTVIEASSGEEGLKNFAEHNDVVLILSDVMMAKMSGPEMIQRILKTDRSVKVLFVTGTDLASSPIGLNDNQYSVLCKPFTLDRLLNSVQECLAT